MPASSSSGMDGLASVALRVRHVAEPVSRGPLVDHNPSGIDALQSSDCTVGWFVDVKGGYGNPTEAPDRSMHRILVRYEGKISRFPLDPVRDTRGHPCPRILERLRREGQMPGIVEIGFEFARKDLGQALPGDAGPSGRELPLEETVVDKDGYTRRVRKPLGSLYRPFQRRGDDAGGWLLGQSCTCCGGLLPSPRGQPEARQVGVNHMLWVFDLAVAYQVDAHGGQSATSRWCRRQGAAGAFERRRRRVGRYRVVMDQFQERFLHVDMDAFFVEVERLREPNLVGVPVIVGGLGRRGVVAAASYEARALGVHSAMPIGEARRLCPHGRFVAPDHGRYGEVSDRAFAVFRSFTPLVEGLSVDEAFLDISGLRLHYPRPRAVGEALRGEIRRQLGLPASVGIAAVKFISKLASDAAKPDGLLQIDAGSELDFLHPMPVRRLWGVGEATHATLESLGVATIGDLASLPEGILVKRLGSSLAAHLSLLAAGKDPREVTPGGDAKSISVEQTYDRDLESGDEVERSLLWLCSRLAARLHRAGMAGHTLTLKVRYGDFETITRSETVSEPMAAGAELWDEARALLERAAIGGRGIRLLGVGVSGLVDGSAPRQLTLDSGSRSLAAETVEKVRERFGEHSVLPASLIIEQSQKRREE